MKCILCNNSTFEIIRKKIRHEIPIKVVKCKKCALISLENPSKNIIDYVKKNEKDLWKATNIGSLNTTGFELDFLYKFESKQGSLNSFSLGYSNLKDDNYSSNINYSKYSLNSIKNHFVSKLNLNYKKASLSTVFKYAERSDGVNYSVLDSKMSYKSFFVSLNNILDVEYSETNLVPMPGRNVLLGFVFGIID